MVQVHPGPRKCDDRRLVKSDFYITERFWWWAPWGTTQCWMPKIYRGGDEWCNVPICYKIPFLGTFVVYWKPRDRKFPCPVEWEHLSLEERADYAPCGWLYDGRVRDEAHHHFEGICEEIDAAFLSNTWPERN